MSRAAPKRLRSCEASNWTRSFGRHQALRIWALDWTENRSVDPLSRPFGEGETGYAREWLLGRSTSNPFRRHARAGQRDDREAGRGAAGHVRRGEGADTARDAGSER